ncbi:MAG TPA: hypothetical protein VEL05_05520 [Candidatus Acidoferrum sp.]|nr:hypothetical protein [Candidatus Acidoferrum sp.]
MERASATWTDERLDDLVRRLDNGFNRLDQDLRSQRIEMNSRFDALHRTILQVGGGMIATFLIGFASLIATRF